MTGSDESTLRAPADPPRSAAARRLAPTVLAHPDPGRIGELAILGSEELAILGSEERRDAGSEERRDAGSEERRDAGSEERRDAGSEERRDAGSEERRDGRARGGGADRRDRRRGARAGRALARGPAAAAIRDELDDAWTIEAGGAGPVIAGRLRRDPRGSLELAATLDGAPVAAAAGTVAELAEAVAAGVAGRLGAAHPTAAELAAIRAREPEAWRLLRRAQRRGSGGSRPIWSIPTGTRTSAVSRGWAWAISGVAATGRSSCSTTSTRAARTSARRAPTTRAGGS
jgi:hypothetical protein